MTSSYVLYTTEWHENIKFPNFSDPKFFHQSCRVGRIRLPGEFWNILVDLLFNMDKNNLGVRKSK